MSSSKILFYFCLAFIAGIFLSSFVHLALPSVLIISIIALVLISVLFRYKKAVVLGCCLIILILGVGRGQTAENGILKLSLDNSAGSVVLIGRVQEEPVKGTRTARFVMETGNGKIMIIANEYPQYHYGDILRIKGDLTVPLADLNGFSYKDYLKKDGIVALITWPEIEKIGSQANPLLAAIFSLKNKLKESINQTLSSPQSGLMEALFFGDEEDIPAALRTKFNTVGIRHLTAVSGMNITIISALILNFLLFLGLGRRPAFYFSIILIAFYILMIGAPASALRAGLMGCLFLTAQYFGRPAAASRLIFLSAALMLLNSPLLLRHDIGFQLSFLAMLGLIWLQPVLADLFKKIPEFFQLRYSLSATLAAQSFTLPILIFNFDRLSLIGPLANVLIVPLIPFVTVLGFIAAVLGMVFLPLGQLASWFVWPFLTYILKLTDYFSGFSFASVSLGGTFWLLLLPLYSALLYLIWRRQNKERLKILKN
jgi:competence protein ComEC